MWPALGCFAVAVLLDLADARATGSFEPPVPEGPGAPAPEPPPDGDDAAGDRELRHLLSFGYSFGRGHSMAVGYLRSYVLKRGFFAAYTYGLEGRLLTLDYTNPDAAVLYGTWRVSFRTGVLWDLDVGLGGGRSRGVMQGSGRAGIHLRVWWVSIGYSYQFATTPTPLPRWFSTHELSVRFEIPVMMTKAGRYRPEEPPASDPAMPDPLFP